MGALVDDEEGIVVAPEETRPLSRMLAGGIAMVLEFVSIVLPESTVALVDCRECASENVEDLTDEEQRENKGVMLTLSTVSISSLSRSTSRCLNLLGVSSHNTLPFGVSLLTAEMSLSDTLLVASTKPALLASKSFLKCFSDTTVLALFGSLAG